MKSNDHSDRLSLDRGLPTTSEDSEALRIAKVARSIGLDEYLLFLSRIQPLAPEELRSRRGPQAESRFTIN
jgi:hypothetical protein